MVPWSCGGGGGGAGGGEGGWGGHGRGAWGGVGCRKRRMLTYGLYTLLFVYLLSAPLRGASPS